MPTEIERAYAAGIVDGEGCLFLNKGHNRLADGERVPNYTALVKVGVADSVLTDWLQERWGGNVNERAATATRKRLYTWKVWGGGAEAFLREIRPYLVIKGEQAKMLLAHRALVGRKGAAVAYRASSAGTQGAQRRPQALTDVHERIYERVKSLNQRAA